jgi:Fe-S-cluster containining protein
MAPRPKITAADCRFCGACCLGGDEGQGWADCTVEDVLRMTRQVRARLVQIRPGWFHTANWVATPTVMTYAGGACAFLRGTPGKRVSCRIYATRPESCRTFKSGSASCRSVRQRLGITTAQARS